ncbi:MAG: hypothetical protein ACO3JL_06800 [Myxococcota bacterium]
MNEVRIPAVPDLRVGVGALVVMWGPPGAGKSYLAAKWLASFSTPTVYLSAEEGLGMTVGERLQRVGAAGRPMTVVGYASIDALAEVCAKTRAKVLLVDSITVTTLSPHDVRTLSQNLRLPLTLVVSQVTKEGGLRGSNELLHEADLGIEVKEGRWKVAKSRYQALHDAPSGEIFSVPNETPTVH